MRKNSILLRTLLLSTSRINVLKHTSDKKKKRNIIGSMIAAIFLYLMIMAFGILICLGYGLNGMIDSAPQMCALTISALSFVFTVFKTNGYLFNFKEYDMLMSLPFDTKSVAACKFMYMYIKSLPWYLSISLALMVGYGIFAQPAFYVYPIWLVLTLFIPLIPMLLASFIGFLIAKISSGFKKTNIVQTVLIFIFVIFCFSSRFIIEDMITNDKVQATLEGISGATDSAAGIYLPVHWFSDAIVRIDVLSIILLIGVSVILFSVIFVIVGGSYRKINSAFKSHAASKSYKLTGLKKKSVLNTIAFKEFKRMTGSIAYMTNVAIGEVLVVVTALVIFILGFDRIVDIITHGAPIDPSILQPSIPFIVYFFIGMVATTVCSPSLEGKNYWIMQSLPVSKKVLYQGKMLFNMYLTVPFTLFGILCICISAKTPVIDMVMYLILGVALCAFSTAWGCVCGVKHMRLDWENEIEVIKQGSAVLIYMLPNMFVVMGLVVGVVFLGFIMNHVLLAAIMTLIAGLLAVLCYLRVMSLAKK